MATPEKRCLYEVLGLHRDCTADEIRSAYKKLALQRHPDKLVQSGVSEAEATASFQELVNAYEFLSDARERAWYDSHRSQILFSGSTPSNSSTVPDLFSFFSNSVFSGYSDTGKGFYKVYSDVFDKIYSNELNFAKQLGLGAVKEAPLMGNLESPYAQVTAFYNYWLGFVTVMDFCWVDQYDVMAGPNRKSRRVMEEENKKLRKKARREYNETVRGLAEFVKKRDKRVIDMQVKRSEEMERKRKEERERKKELERERMERARAYEEQEWAKIEDDGEIEENEEIEDEKKKSDGKELYCVVCGKKFKSEKQWKNHEQSKKHKEKVAELREAFGDEEREEEREEEGKGEEVLRGDGDEGCVDGGGFVSADDDIDELPERVKSSFGFQEEQRSEAQSSEEEGFVDIDDGGALNGVGESFGSDDEAGILEAMVSGRKGRKNAALVGQPKAKASMAKARVEDDSDEMESMAYNNGKSTRRNRGARRERGNRSEEEATRPDGESKVENDGLHLDESSSHSFMENETNGKGDELLQKTPKVKKQPVDKKGAAKRDTNTKPKNSSKGRKQKGISRSSDNVCEACGEEFESRNKLHKHLGDTGHATLKSR